MKTPNKNNFLTKEIQEKYKKKNGEDIGEEEAKKVLELKFLIQALLDKNLTVEIYNVCSADEIVEAVSLSDDELQSVADSAIKKSVNLPVKVGEKVCVVGDPTEYTLSEINGESARLLDEEMNESFFSVFDLYSLSTVKRFCVGLSLVIVEEKIEKLKSLKLKKGDV